MTALPEQFEVKNITKRAHRLRRVKGQRSWRQRALAWIQIHPAPKSFQRLIRNKSGKHYTATRPRSGHSSECSYTSLSLTLCFRFSVYGHCCRATAAKTQIEKCYDDNEPSVLNSPRLVCSIASQKFNPQRGVTGRSCLVLQQERNLNISGPGNILKDREQQPAFWSQPRIILWT